MSLKRSHSSQSERREYVTSPKITDRSSTFLGFYSPSLPARALQAEPEISDASHKIAAWRLPSRQKTLHATTSSASSDANVTYETGHDDDGERGAGARLSKLLRESGIVGTVVVARWYGGVLLGPVRFTHIERCAQEAVELWEEMTGSQCKKAKVDAQINAEKAAKDKERLVKELPQRDESIEVLRKLLAQKKGQEEPHETTPGKVVIYGTMSIQVLKRLEKARDATIAYLLKQISEAEKEESQQAHEPTLSNADS